MLKKVFCVDDDSIALMLYKMVIKKAAFTDEIITAYNGQEALEYYDTLLSENSEPMDYPELIFLDLNMPIMGGWEFLERFSNEEYAAFRDTKVIILSSTIDPADLRRVGEFPIVIDFLSKPISKEMLENLKSKWM